MKLKHLLIYLFIPLALASCKKDRDETENPETEILQPPVAPKPYSINENFESGIKAGYDVADVTISTGSWSMNGALLGSDAGDIRNGGKSVRIQGTKDNAKRNGNLAMNFDVTGLKSVIIKSSFANFADKQFVTATNPVALKGSWELQSSKDGGKTYTKVGQTITETDIVLVAHTFQITDPAAQRFIIVNTSDYNGSNRVRLSIDDITFVGEGESGITIGGSDTPPDDGGGTSTGTPTTPRGINIGTDAPPATGDNSNLLFGNPSAANMISAENYLLDMGYYVESYSKSRGTPNWVSWHLDNTNTTNATGRLDNFAGFKDLPAGYYQVQSTSYSGSGFDRGHNCPSADRTSSTFANSATFLMTNMIPQAPQNNQQTWNNLESYLRLQVNNGNEVYVIMGSYGIGGVGSKSTATVTTIDNGNVTVPSNVWKVAVIIPAGDRDLIRAGNTSGIRVIAVNTPNVNTINSDWTKYIVSVRDIETAVGNGFNLLGSLPQSVQDAIEVKKDSGI
ncbi:DNA/RNA non-specific endonuclease [Mucilaginibacter sp. PAMB04168]|uniref:DNA/RNA non-specific endonuclease n=1 Tax=Mucilaginibacter sp. PAMB04168 TaxID=3138567 RepID=UPI0031F6352E